MKWFKHYTNAHKGTVLQHLSNDFSVNEAYALYFRFVEYLSDKWDGCGEPRFTINERELKKFLTVSSRKFNCFLTVMQKQLHIDCAKNQKLLIIHFPKLLEIRHKDDLSSEIRPASGPPISRLDKNKRKNNTSRIRFSSGEELLASLPEKFKNEFAVYAPDWFEDQVRSCFDWHAEKQPKTAGQWRVAIRGWVKRSNNKVLLADTSLGHTPGSTICGVGDV